jgi:hypothetical protein
VRESISAAAGNGGRFEITVGSFGANEDGMGSRFAAAVTDSLAGTCVLTDDELEVFSPAKSASHLFWNLNGSTPETSARQHRAESGPFSCFHSIPQALRRQRIKSFCQQGLTAIDNFPGKPEESGRQLRIRDINHVECLAEHPASLTPGRFARSLPENEVETK